MARSPTTSDPFNAVAEPQRRKVLDALRVGPHTVGELATLLGMSQPQVSKHLRVLREVGLVEVQESGRQRIYQLNLLPLQDLSRWLKPFEELWSSRFGHLDAVLEALKQEEHP